MCKIIASKVDSTKVDITNLWCELDNVGFQVQSIVDIGDNPIFRTRSPTVNLGNVKNINTPYSMKCFWLWWKLFHYNVFCCSRAILESRSDPSKKIRQVFGFYWNFEWGTTSVSHKDLHRFVMQYLYCFITYFISRDSILSSLPERSPRPLSWFAAASRMTHKTWQWEACLGKII